MCETPFARRSRGLLSLLLLGALGGFVFLPTGVEGQGFAFYQHGACATARAGAASALPCDDGSAVFYNPGALTDGPGWSFSGGAVSVFSRADFTSDRTGTTTEMDVDPRVAPHFFARYGMSERLGLGVGLYAPYAFGTGWPRDFQGSFISFDSSLGSIYLQPTVAYRIHDRLSVGVGVTGVVSWVELNRNVDLAEQVVPGLGATWSTLGIPPGTAFAQATLSGDRALGVGAHIGLQARLNDRVHLGARFLAPVTLEYEGTARFQQVETGIRLPAQNPLGVPADTPLDQVVASAFVDGPLVEQDARTQVTLPAQLAGGLAVQAAPEVLLSADLLWVNWSSFERVELEFEDSRLDDVLVQNYQDALAVRVGAEVELAPEWKLRGGYVYNQSASPEETVTPLVPEGERNHLTVGLGWELQPGIRLDAAYHRLMQNDRRGRTLNPPSGTAPSVDLNDGLYTVDAHLLGFTLSVER